MTAATQMEGPAGRTVTLLRGAVAGPRSLRRCADGAGQEPYRHFEVRPLARTIGAELVGPPLVDLSDAAAAELHRALLEWKVLFFRDQRMTSVQQRDFAARWGELEVHPFLPPGSTADVVRFEKETEKAGNENVWHSDVSWRVAPSLGAVLRCLETPAVGGDTLWADMYAAYDGLPAELRDRLDGLRAVHDFSASFGTAMAPERLAEMKRRFPAVEHPVVRTHPETGRRLLYVNEIFTTHVVGMDRADSDELLGLLCAQARVPEYQCRFHWTAGTVAFWDNRATQHYAVSDYFPDRRVMERISIIGDRPF